MPKRLVVILFTLILLLSCNLFTPELEVNYRMIAQTWTHWADNDDDGYYSVKSFSFYIKSEPDSLLRTIYYKLYYKQSGTSTYSLYYRSENDTMTGSYISPELYIGYPNTELDSGFYDFELKIFELGNLNPKIIYGPDHLHNMDSIKFETSVED